MPSHLRPFGELEPIQRTLASLDVDRTDYRYHPTILREAATVDADEDVKEWIELAVGLDYSARLLIQSALRAAAQRAASQAEPWVELAGRAGADEGARLEGFAELGASMAKELRAELGFGSAESD